MEVSTKRTFGQDLTVFQSAAMRARAKSAVAEAAAAAAAAAASAEGVSEEQTQRINTAVGSILPNAPVITVGGGGGVVVGGGRRRRGGGSDTHDQDAVDMNSWLHLPETTLSEPDERGLCRMHHAAARGFVPILQKAEAFNKQLLELKTNDGTAMTPLLVAVQAGNLESVKGLTELGAKLDAVDNKGHGVVELCTARQDHNILNYYIHLNNSRLPVWRRMIKLVKSDFVEEAEPAVHCLHRLTSDLAQIPSSACNANVTCTAAETDDSDVGDSARSGKQQQQPAAWRSFHEESVVAGLVHVLKVSNNETVRRLGFQCLFNVIENKEVREQAATAGIIPVLARLLTDNSPLDRVRQAAALLTSLADTRQFVEDVQRQAVYSALVTAVGQILASPATAPVDVSTEVTTSDGDSDDRRTDSRLDALTEIVETMGRIVRGQTVIQSAFGSTPAAFSTIASLYDLSDVTERFMTSLSQSVSSLASLHYGNQRKFVAAGILERLVSLANHQKASHEVQLAAVNAFRELVNGNKDTQKVVLVTGLVEAVWKVVKRSAEPAMRRSAAGALWTVAEADIEERRRLAELMSPSTFIDFIVSATGPLGGPNDNGQSNELLVIGAQGIEVLWSGVHPCVTSLNEVGTELSSTISTLTQLFSGGRAPVVVSAGLRAMRAICIGVGFVPRLEHQNSICRTVGLQYIATLAASATTTYNSSLPRETTATVATTTAYNNKRVNTTDDLVKVEAAITLAVIQLGNKNSRDEIEDLVRGSDPYDVARLVGLLNGSSDLRIQLLAGEALATFAYNNLSNQRAIMATIRDKSQTLRCDVYYDKLLKAEDELSRCNAAFQLVVLSPLFDDEQPASASATGIKVLIDCLGNSTNDSVKVLAADCIGRLAHTRAENAITAEKSALWEEELALLQSYSIPEALVAVGAVELLCDLLLSNILLLSSTASIAIGFLSFNHNARRRLLNRCRLCPALMTTLVRYCSVGGKLPPELASEWKHYENIGLPTRVDDESVPINAEQFESSSDQRPSQTRISAATKNSTVPQPMRSNSILSLKMRTK